MKKFRVSDRNEIDRIGNITEKYQEFMVPNQVPAPVYIDAQVRG